MDPKLQRRVQRYGWDLAAGEYESLWQAQLFDAQSRLLDWASLTAGERVLDVACGTGLVTTAAADEVGPRGSVVGVDLSALMIAAAARRATQRQLSNVRFERMDAEALALPDTSFDVALCALGLMYLPNPEQAISEMRRVLRPGGRVALAVWGERARCGWSELFPIVDAEVRSEVCPLFFRLGQGEQLARLCVEAGFRDVRSCRIESTLDYADADAACNAAFVAGPVALAWSRFDADARERARARYVASIEPWRNGSGYHVPGEFVVVAARVPGA